jgi:hypothetical protein
MKLLEDLRPPHQHQPMRDKQISAGFMLRARLHPGIARGLNSSGWLPFQKERRLR